MSRNEKEKEQEQRGYSRNDPRERGISRVESGETTTSEAGRRLVERFNRNGYDLPNLVRTNSGTSEYSQSSIGSHVSNHTVTPEIIRARNEAARALLVSGPSSSPVVPAGGAGVSASSSVPAGVSASSPVPAVVSASSGEPPKSGSSFGGRRYRKRSRVHRKSKRHTKHSKKRRS